MSDDDELLQVMQDSAIEALREKLIAAGKYNGDEIEMKDRLNDANWNVDLAFELYKSTPRAKTPLTISLPPLTAASDFLNQGQNKTKKIKTPIKTSQISEILRNARNDISEYRPSTAESKKNGLIYSSPKLAPLPKISAHTTRETSQPVWSCPKCTFENNSNTKECVVCGSSDTDVQAPMTYQHYIISNVFVFGYQNSAQTFEYKQINKPIPKKQISPNLFTSYIKHLYKEAVQSEWTEEIQSIHVYVPKGSKGILNRPAPATVETENNTNKTFVNVFIHDWLFYGNKPDENYELLKNPYLKIIEKTKGIENTKGDGISVYPITETWTKVQYHLHNLNDDKPSYSPDTGLIVLNDSDYDEQFCRILCVDKDTNRLLILTIRFYRTEKAYNDYVTSVDKKRPGGKSRRRNTRKPRRNQRRRTKRL